MINVKWVMIVLICDLSMYISRDSCCSKNTRNTTTNYVEELEHMAKSLLNYKYLHIFQSLFFCDSKVELDIYYLSSGYVHSSKITCPSKTLQKPSFLRNIFKKNFIIWIWQILLEHFIKHKPLIPEEYLRTWFIIHRFYSRSYLYVDCI